jgi:hypothetical protein
MQLESSSSSECHTHPLSLTHICPPACKELSKSNLQPSTQSYLEKAHQTADHQPQVKLLAHAESVLCSRQPPVQILANKLGSNVMKPEPENHLKRKLEAHGISKGKSKQFFRLDSPSPIPY